MGQLKLALTTSILFATLSACSSISKQSDIGSVCSDYDGYMKDACLTVKSSNEDPKLGVKTLLGLLEWEKEHNHATFELYLKGIAQGLQAANVGVKETGQAGLYCAPEDFIIGDEAERLLRKDAEKYGDDPNYDKVPANIVLATTVMTEHPCD
jgi:hypothetical protein